MKKYFYNFFLILTNIKNYGFVTILKASFIELFYLIKFRDFKSYIYDDTFTSTYEQTKYADNYNTQHTPTPYFFLKIGADFIDKEKLNDFVILDLGCGYGRVGDFFLNKFKCVFYGIEINKNFIDYLNLKKNKIVNYNLYNTDLKNKNKREEIFAKVASHRKKIIIFISDPFDIHTIIEILKYFKDLDHLILGVNINQIEKLYEDYKKLYIKTFNKGLRHITLMKLHI
mgnify:FL=1